MPSSAKKKNKAAPPQSNTLDSFLARPSAPLSKATTQNAKSHSSPSPSRLAAADGNTEQSPLVISDDESEKDHGSDGPSSILSVSCNKGKDPAYFRNRSRSSPERDDAVLQPAASLAPRPTDLASLKDSLQIVKDQIETGASSSAAAVDPWGEGDEGMELAPDDPSVLVDLTMEEDDNSTGSDWDTDNEGIEYERGEKRKLQDDIADRRRGDGGAKVQIRRPLSAYGIPDNASSAPGSPSVISKPSRPNAFAMLMKGPEQEDVDWKAAEIDLKRDGTRVVGRRKAPFYKVLTGFPIAVDAFRYQAIPGVTAYFLTHAHSDHYTNLSASWKHGPIYCSETTANLIKLMLGVEPHWVVGIPWDTAFEIPNTGGVKVTLIHANHCPGSALFMFEGKQTIDAGDSTFKSRFVGGKRTWRYLHCGDFRACPAHLLHPAVKDRQIDTVYLDSTYMQPAYCFPPQPLVIKACADLCRRLVSGLAPTKPEPEAEGGDEEDVTPYLAGQIGAETFEMQKNFMDDWLIKEEEVEKTEDTDAALVKAKRTLVIIGTYSIGKERIAKGVAKALQTKIYCDARKREILKSQADSELHQMLTDDPTEAGIHLVPLQTIQLDRLQPYLHRLKDSFSRILAFRPTGWTYTPPAGTDTLPKVETVIQRDQKRTFTANHLRPMRGSCRQIMMFGCPYSEHSSFFELSCFALSLPSSVRYIPTVNVGSEKSRAKMKKWFERWCAERLRREKAGETGIVPYRDETFW